jgi:hypothetical protein
MEWSGQNTEQVIQQLDRKQESKLIYCKVSDGGTTTFLGRENDDAWVDLNTDNPCRLELDQLSGREFCGK